MLPNQLARPLCGVECSHYLSKLDHPRRVTGIQSQENIPKVRNAPFDDRFKVTVTTVAINASAPHPPRVL